MISCTRMGWNHHSIIIRNRIAFFLIITKMYFVHIRKEVTVMLNIRFVGIIPSIDVRPERPWSDKSERQRLITQRRNIQACIDRIKEVQFLIRQQMSRSRSFGFGLDFLFPSWGVVKLGWIALCVCHLEEREIPYTRYSHRTPSIRDFSLCSEWQKSTTQRGRMSSIFLYYFPW